MKPVSEYIRPYVELLYADQDNPWTGHCYNRIVEYPFKDRDIDEMIKWGFQYGNEHSIEDMWLISVRVTAYKNILEDGTIK